MELVGYLVTITAMIQISLFKTVHKLMLSTVLIGLKQMRYQFGVLARILLLKTVLDLMITMKIELHAALTWLENMRKLLVLNSMTYLRAFQTIASVQVQVVTVVLVILALEWQTVLGLNLQLVVVAIYLISNNQLM